MSQFDDAIDLLNDTLQSTFGDAATYDDRSGNPARPISIIINRIQAEASIYSTAVPVRRHQGELRLSELSREPKRGDVIVVTTGLNKGTWTVDGIISDDGDAVSVYLNAG
jgi:hypothetical protein